MCGRFTYLFTWKELHRLMNLTSWPAEELSPRYNVAPTQVAPVVRGEPGGRAGVMMRWGLIPSWADDPTIGNRMINARGETLAEKPAFRKAFAQRRCLVPISGFYEWKAGGRAKTPFCIRRVDRQPFMLAGLWERWSKVETIESFTILTTTPNSLLESIHDRMPIIIDADGWDQWLDPGITEAASVAQLICPHAVDGFEAVQVSTRVNSPRNDDPSIFVESQQNLY